jgi:hypothetical protein
MDSKKHPWIALAIAPVLAAFLAAPTVGQAATHKKHVRCEITKDGNVETQKVATAKECTAMGGKVVAKKHAARKPHK